MLLIATGCGIYQSYICYAASLFLLDCIVELLTGGDLGRTVRIGLRYIGVLLAALAVYYGVETLLLKLNHTVLTTYMGMDVIGSFDVAESLRTIPKAYREYLQFFRRWSFAIPVLRYFHYLTAALLLVSVCYLIHRKGLWKQPVRCVLIFAGWGLFPLTMNLASVLAYNGSLHRLMIYAFILLFVAAVKCAELAAQAGMEAGGVCARRMGTVLSTAAVVCCCAVAWNNFCLCNVGYHALQLNYEASYAIAERVADRIEALDGYTTDSPVAIIGFVDPSVYGTRDRYMSDFDTALEGQMLGQPIVYRPAFLRDYIGFPMPALTGEQRAFLNDSKEVSAMPAFPAQGSVAMIAGIAVVKLGEGGVQ